MSYVHMNIVNNPYNGVICKTSIVLNIYLFLSTFQRQDNTKIIFKNLNIIILESNITYQMLNAKQAKYIMYIRLLIYNIYIYYIH